MKYELIDMDYNNRNNDSVISVSEAIRMNFGTINVQGMIISMSKLFKMISGINFYCESCDKLIELNYPSPKFSINFDDKKCFYCYKLAKNIADFKYVSAVIIELQDIESFNDIDRMPVILFDEDTIDIRVGEKVTIKGTIEVVKLNNKSKLFPFLYANQIEYENRKSQNLTNLDIEAIQRFTNRHGNDIADILASLVEPSILGNEFVKKAILLAAVNTENEARNSYESKRDRINILLVSEPGLGKSRLLRAAVRIVRKSRYESGQNSSGKSLTAIIVKEEENYILRLGPATLAKNSICAVNEIGKMNLEDQAHLLDILEEGKFTINKHGINAVINAPYFNNSLNKSD